MAKLEAAILQEFKPKDIYELTQGNAKFLKDMLPDAKQRAQVAMVLAEVGSKSETFPMNQKAVAQVDEQFGDRARGEEFVRSSVEEREHLNPSYG